MKKEILCPCGTKKTYATCCKPFHQGKKVPSALELMRSRYSAYALGSIDYIMETTHPANPQFSMDRSEWSQKISAFCKKTQYKGLEILNSQEIKSFATVTFIAHLSQKGEDVSFTEKSFFEKVKGKWLYRSGHLEEGRAPNLITTDQLRLLPLAYYGDPILRKIAEPVGDMTDDLRTLIAGMIETMDGCDGIGLAAPQVHHSIRLFVIRKPIEVGEGKIDVGAVKVFINPKISMPSKETWKVSEGCLSIPSIHADVERPESITVEYSDLDGNRITEKVFGWEARVILHENDHIDGILFIDRVGDDEKKALEPFLHSLHKKIHDGTEL